MKQYTKDEIVNILNDFCSTRKKHFIQHIKDMKKAVIADDVLLVDENDIDKANDMLQECIDLRKEVTEIMCNLEDVVNSLCEASTEYIEEFKAEYHEDNDEN